MYMIIIKIDMLWMSSDAMQFEHLDILRCYAGERVKPTNAVVPLTIPTISHDARSRNKCIT